MRILVLGSGGREHALVSSLLRSGEPGRKVFCAPGNVGIAAEAELLSSSGDSPEGLQKLADLAQERAIDLTIVGPEAPLVAGIVDLFEARGLRIFGPNAKASQLEGSKCFSKEFLARHEIPTAGFRIFDGAKAALAHVEQVSLPVVLKADGLAAGKGVLIARTREEARAGVEAILVERRFGSAGNRLLVEDFLPGSEVSLLVLTDGERAIPLETAQDYKPALDGDRGPNTGGMGAFSPYLPTTHPLVETALVTIVEPTLRGLQREGILFRGILYVGLMVTDSGPQVLEFNVRFGDPETQAILVRLETDLAEALQRATEGRLDGFHLRWSSASSVCVVMAAGGYPGSYETGAAISGLEGPFAPGVKVFHAGTRLSPGGEVVTAGGRVLGVTALGATRGAAREAAYEAVGRIRFDRAHYRRDIAGQDR